MFTPYQEPSEVMNDTRNDPVEGGKFSSYKDAYDAYMSHLEVYDYTQMEVDSENREESNVHQGGKRATEN